MAEGKKREYKRETVSKVYNELRERVRVVNEQNHILIVKDIIVFGSFINSNNPLIHDLDVCFITNKVDFYDKSIHKISNERLSKRRPNTYFSFTDVLNYPVNEIIWYLKKKQGIISLHSIDDIDAAKYQKHIYLMKDSIFLENPLICYGTK